MKLVPWLCRDSTAVPTGASAAKVTKASPPTGSREALEERCTPDPALYSAGAAVPGTWARSRG